MLDQFFITVNSDWPTHSKEPRTPSFCECRAIQKDRFISQRRWELVSVLFRHGIHIFHKLEDRATKNLFQLLEDAGHFKEELTSRSPNPSLAANRVESPGKDYPHHRAQSQPDVPRTCTETQGLRMISPEQQMSAPARGKELIAHRSSCMPAVVKGRHTVGAHLAESLQAMPSVVCETQSTWPGGPAPLKWFSLEACQAPNTRYQRRLPRSVSVLGLPRCLRLHPPLYVPRVAPEHAPCLLNSYPPSAICLSLSLVGFAHCSRELLPATAGDNLRAIKIIKVKLNKLQSEPMRCLRCWPISPPFKLFRMTSAGRIRVHTRSPMEMLKQANSLYPSHGDNAGSHIFPGARWPDQVARNRPSESHKGPPCRWEFPGIERSFLIAPTPEKNLIVIQDQMAPSAHTWQRVWDRLPSTAGSN